jgi:integrase
MTGHTAAAGLVVASQCHSASTRGRCERCGQCVSRSAALGPSEGPGFGGCATAMKIPGRGVIDTEGKKVDNSLVGSKRGQNIVGKRTVSRSAPTTVNSSVRTREYLTTAEIERLMAAARKSSRYGHRDATMILISYRHGLRASELCDLQWSQVELATGRLHVRRAKNGAPSVHPMQGDEIRALRRLQREQGVSSHVFMTERDGPMTPKAFHALFGRIGARAKMQFPIHPHMLRHGCGYALANAGHDTRALQAWLGHKNIQHTVRYTELAPDRFKNFWR